MLILHVFGPKAWLAWTNYHLVGIHVNCLSLILPPVSYCLPQTIARLPGSSWPQFLYNTTAVLCEPLYVQALKQTGLQESTVTLEIQYNVTVQQACIRGISRAVTVDTG